MTRRRRLRVLPWLATAGVVLLVAGLFGDRIAMGIGFVDRFHGLSPEFDAESEDATVLEDTLRAVERAARTGDLVRLRVLLTPEYFARLEAERRGLGGRPLDGFELHDVATLVGDLNRLSFRVGRSDGSRAVIVYEVRGVDGPPRGFAGETDSRTRLQAFRFAWSDDGELMLDGKRAHWLEPGGELDPWVTQWLAE